MAAKVERLEPNEFQKSRGFAPAVITAGGRTVWMTGQTCTQDADGRDIAGDFDAQARACFAAMDATLRRCGGSLANLVTMTVYIQDARAAADFVPIRKAQFPDEAFPASTLLVVSGFARPGVVIEIQGVAVV
jgi:enamine deaminase RidA (YjgF/YER057c/UK114 family)